MQVRAVPKLPTTPRLQALIVVAVVLVHAVGIWLLATKVKINIPRFAPMMVTMEAAPAGTAAAPVRIDVPRQPFVPVARR